MDVCKRVYHLPFKRPRWWMKITIKAITINWIQSIIQSEATQGDKRHFSLLNCFLNAQAFFLFLFLFLVGFFYLQMWYVQSTATPTCPFGNSHQWNEFKKPECSRRSCTSKRWRSLEQQSNNWAQLLSNTVKTTTSISWANNHIRLTENQFAKLTDLRLCLCAGGGRGICCVIVIIN